MGIPTLIKTQAADDDSELIFVDGTDDVVLDGTYDEYMFVFTALHPETDNTKFTFQGSTDGGSNYNTTITSTAFYSTHKEDGSQTSLAYAADEDKAQDTTYQDLNREAGIDNDQSSAGIFHLFSPASAVYVKHFYSRLQTNQYNDWCGEVYVAGYLNTTSAIDAISFKQSSGNFSGVVQMYGIA